MTISPEARERAEARFIRKQVAKVEGAEAMTDYVTDARLTREKTERLRGERLARDATQKAAGPQTPAAKAPRKPRAKRAGEPSKVALAQA